MNPTDVELLREEFLKYGCEFTGTFYTWGGDDPSSFDCSGLAVELCKSVGLLPRGGDWTADGLMRKFYKFVVQKPYAGCLVFNRNAAGVAIHVEICINHLQTIGASGGGSHVKTREDAIKYNAFVKKRPIRGTVFIDPFKKLLTIP